MTKEQDDLSEIKSVDTPDLSENEPLESELISNDIEPLIETSHLELSNLEEAEPEVVLPPEPVDGLDVFTTVDVSYDVAQYGDRQFFTYTLGEVEKTSSWLVPEGTVNGAVFTFKGQGNPGLFGGKNGDLIVSVTVLERERGEDIVHPISVSWEHAKYEHLAKITLQVDGEEREVKFSLPAGLKSDQYVRVRGAGRSHGGSLPAGDLIIKVTVEEPQPPEDYHAYAIVGFWAGVKLFFRLTPEVKIYRITNNQYLKSFKKLKKKHLPEISWTFPGEGERGEAHHPDADLYLTPHFTSNAYRAPWVATFAIFAFLGLGIFGQQALTWTGNEAFYANILSDPVQSGPSSSTRNENISYETSTPNWAPDGFQLIASDPNVAVRMPDPSTYNCTAQKTLNCLSVEVYTKIKCDVLTANVTFYSEDLSQNDTAKVEVKKVVDLKVITVMFYPHSKKPLPKWDYLTITCSKAK